eukprot:5988403-Lingulodinium_polyedra.AAC.1
MLVRRKAFLVRDHSLDVVGGVARRVERPVRKELVQHRRLQGEVGGEAVERVLPQVVRVHALRQRVGGRLFR